MYKKQKRTMQLIKLRNLMQTISLRFLRTAKEGQDGKIGTRLAYCLENVVKVDNQLPAMVTGIIFRAQILIMKIIKQWNYI